MESKIKSTRYCPKCKKVYRDTEFTFCPKDGVILLDFVKEEKESAPRQLIPDLKYCSKCRVPFRAKAVGVKCPICDAPLVLWGSVGTERFSVPNYTDEPFKSLMDSPEIEKALATALLHISRKILRGMKDKLE